MSETPILKVGEMARAVSSKEVIFNEAVRRLEAMGQLAVLAIENDPPASPADGARYIVGDTPTGAWVGREGQIAVYSTNAWFYIEPWDGCLAKVTDEGVRYEYIDDSDPSWELFDPASGAYVPLSYLDTDGTLAADSDTKVATQKAVRTYVATAVTGLLDFKGSTDASSNPNYPAASKGDAYMVSVAGKIGGASGITVAVGDVYFAIADNAGGTQAAVGSSWDVLQYNTDFASVAITGGTITGTTFNNGVIGGVTPAAGTFTALTATGAVALSPASANVVLSPTGTGVVTINPATAGTLNNVVIGGTTPLAGTFTTLNGTTLTLTGAIILGGQITSTLAGGGSVAFTQIGEAAVNNSLRRYSADANGPQIVMRKSRGTIASPAGATLDDPLGQINWQTQYSTTTNDFNTSAILGVYAAESASSSTTTGTYASWELTPVGSGTRHEVLRMQPSLTAAGLKTISQRSAIVNNNVLGGVDIWSNDTQMTAPGNLVVAYRGIASETHTSTAGGARAAIYATPNTTLTPLEVARFVSVASSVNAWQFNNSATGSAVSVNAIGTDTDVGITFTPKAAGVITLAGATAVTGNLNTLTISATVVAHGNTGTTETFDAAAGDVHSATLDNNCTFTLSNSAASGKRTTLELWLTQDATGNRTITWPASCKGEGGGAVPAGSTAANAVDVWVATTIDGGTIWRVALAVKGS